MTTSQECRLILVSGAAAELGKAYVDYFAVQPHVTCVGLTRRPASGKAQKYVALDLLDAQACQEKISQLSLEGITEAVFIHSVGKFKFEELGRPETDKNNDGIDDEVYESNVCTFTNVALPLMDKVNQEHEKSRFVRLALVGFGSVSDKYRVPFWQSYTKSKDALRDFIRYAVGHEAAGLLRGLFVNVSTADTGNEQRLRPCADKTYWLKPEEIVAQSVPHIVDDGIRWKEIDIYKPSPLYARDQYTNLSAILRRWKNEMGKS